MRALYPTAKTFWLGYSCEPDGVGHTPLPDMGPGHHLDA